MVVVVPCLWLVCLFVGRGGGMRFYMRGVLVCGPLLCVYGMEWT